MLKLNQPAPAFKQPAYQKGIKDDFTEISLEDYKGKWVILFFYPRDFTFVCPTEIEGFAKMNKDFEKLNTVVVAASTDSVFSHKAWFERDLKDVEFPILADTNHTLSRDYGVLNESDGTAERGTFIIDPDGNLRYVVISDGNVGRSVEETMRVVKALQTGGLCPVDWEPGEANLKPE
ncbi:thioredoxin peroxidase [Candidatus Saccharibacteria bacterium]|jgi:peroxiredoxin (alkyl hydroperoxide reductase subunit C)|nr:thioredoxin peroxidase [Candidatus Saccharibacteria bacterium]